MTIFDGDSETERWRDIETKYIERSMPDIKLLPVMFRS